MKANLRMYENHQHHIRGDMVSGTSFAYECLWRCRLMLRLSPLDTIAIYKGEDARITIGDGKEVYYQIKYSIRYWTYPKMKKFLDRAEAGLEGNPHFSYVFCTNAPLDSNAQKKFDEMSQKWGDRLRINRWEPNLDDPLDRIHADIRQVLERHFQPRNITKVLNFGQVDNCRDKLLTLETQLKLKIKNSINGDEVWERTGLKQLAEEIPSLILGKQLFTWSSWVEKARTEDTNPALSATRSVVIDHKGVHRDIEDKLFEFVSQWGRNPSESHLLLIRGVSGTGKTWLLLQLGMHFSEQFPVYWANGSAIGERPKIISLSSWENKPTIVLIDNLIEEEFSRLIIEALRSRPTILIIGTTSMPRYYKEINLLEQRCGEKFIYQELDSLPNEEEVNKLVAYIRKGIISRRERESLRSTNIRYAVRLLEGRESQADFVNRMYNLWHQDKYQNWVMPLLLCSSLSVKIPRSALREYARSKPRAALEMPEELWPVILCLDREDYDILWLEDPDVTQKVFDIIIDKDVNRETLEDSLFEATVGLISKIHIEFTLHRKFARRIVRRFCETYYQYQEQLLQKCKDTIFQLLDREPHWALAYIWLPLLPQAGMMIEATRKAARNFLSEPPQSIADVVLLIEAFGDERAREIIRQELQGIRQWDAELWATFVEHLTPLDSRSQRELLRLSIPLLQCGPIDLVRLLKTREVDIHLASLIGKCGLSEQRVWFLNLLTDIFPESPDEEALKRHYLIPQYLNLTTRCIMQPRNALSIVVHHKLIGISSQNKKALQPLYGETYDSYRTIYKDEVEKRYYKMALKSAINYAKALSNAPTKANNLWTAILSFAERWASSEERKQIEHQVIGFLRKVSGRGLPLHLVESTAHQLARVLLSSSHVSKLKIRVLLELLVKSPRTQAPFQLFLLLIAIVGNQVRFKKSLAKQAKEVLVTLACNGGENAKYFAENFLKNLEENIGISVERFALFPIPEPNRLPDPIVENLLTCLWKIQWDDAERKRLVDTIYIHWRENSMVRRHLLLTLLNLGGAQQAREIVQMLMTTASDDPNNLLLACTWEAKFGDPQEAKKHMANALRLYEQKAMGAHLKNISRACIDLARCSESPESEIFELCGALTCLGSLKFLEEVLQLV